MGQVQSEIIAKLEKALSPSHLEVIMSASHNVPEGLRVTLKWLLCQMISMAITGQTAPVSLWYFGR